MGNNSDHCSPVQCPWHRQRISYCQGLQHTRHDCMSCNCPAGFGLCMIPEHRQGTSCCSPQRTCLRRTSCRGWLHCQGNRRHCTACSRLGHSGLGIYLRRRHRLGKRGWEIERKPLMALLMQNGCIDMETYCSPGRSPAIEWLELTFASGLTRLILICPWLIKKTEEARSVRIGERT